MNEGFSGGVAVITGAARGIGEGIARSAAGRGMKLVLADIDVNRLRALGDEFSQGGTETLVVPTDVADPSAIDRLADAAFDRFGAVRMLVNNAGIEVIGYSWDISTEQWERAVRINALGPIHGVRAFAGRMITARQPAYIVNVTSLAALGTMPFSAPYFVTKHATLSFSESLFLEMQRVAPMIRVSAVLPGPVKTGIFEDALSGGERSGVEKHRSIMSSLLAKAMDPREAGETILNQVAAGKFWVTTHPEIMAGAALRRANVLRALEDPILSADGKALLGD